MDQDKKIEILKLIQETLGIETIEEITPDSEFIADLNASIEEIKTIITQTEEALDIEMEFREPYQELTVNKFFETLEESFI